MCGNSAVCCSPLQHTSCAVRRSGEVVYEVKAECEVPGLLTPNIKTKAHVRMAHIVTGMGGARLW